MITNNPFPEKNESMEPELAFGVTHMKNSIWQLEGETTEIVYLSGKVITRKQLATMRTRLTLLSDNVEKINFLGVSPDSSCFIVSETIKRDQSLLLGIYNSTDGKKRVFKVMTGVQGNFFKAFDFSTMNPNLVLLSTSSNQVYLLDLTKLRHIAYLNLESYDNGCMRLCPEDSHLASISGKTGIRLYRIQEYTLKELQPIKGLPRGGCTTHTWNVNILFIGNEQGWIFWAYPTPSGYHVKQQVNLNSPILHLNAKGSKLISISSDSKVLLWESDYQDSKTAPYYETTRTWLLPTGRADSVESVLVTSKFQRLVLGFSDNYIGISDLQWMYDRGPLTRLLDIDYIYKGCHSEGISSIDKCLQRPIVASCSKIDRSIRVWNYALDRCDLVKFYNSKNDPMIECVALHPSGYYMAAGFVDRLKILHLVHNDLREYKQVLLKNVSLLRFSDSGAFLSASSTCESHQAGSFQLLLMDSYTLQTIHYYNDWNSPIISAKFFKHDSVLVAMCNGGGIKLYTISSESPPFKISARTQRTYTSMVGHKQEGVKGSQNISVFSCSSNPKQGSLIRQCKQVAQKYVQKLYDVREYKIGVLEIFYKQSRQAHRLLAGCEEGVVVLYSVPFDGIPLVIINVHCSPVSDLLISPCSSRLFSSCKSGVIVGSRIQHNKDVQGLPASLALDSSLSDIMLVSITNMIQTQQKNKKLVTGLTEVEHRSTEIQDDLRRKYQQKLTKQHQQKEKEISNLNDCFQKHLKETKQQEQRHLEEIAEVEKRNRNALSELENLYQRKIYMESEQNMRLKSQINMQEFKYTEEMTRVSEVHKDNVGLLTSEFNSMLNKTANLYRKQASKKDLQQRKYQLTLKEVDEEYQQEIQELISKHNKQEASTKQALYRLTAQHQSLKTEFNLATRSNNDKDQQILQLNEQIEYLRRESQSKQKQFIEIDGLLSQKKAFLTEGHGKISQLQTRYTQLQKKKNILNVKAIQWRQSIHSIEQEVQRLKAKLFQLQAQLDKVLHNQENHLNNLESLENERLRLNRIVKEQGAHIKTGDAASVNILLDIKTIIDKPKQSNRMVYDEVVAMYRKYQAPKRVTVTAQGMGEVNRQVMHLQRALETHTKSSLKTLDQRNSQLTKRSVENNQLIRDINDYRVRYKQQALQIKSKQKIIDDLMIDKNRSMRKTTLHQNTPTTKLPTSIGRSSSVRIHKLAKGSNFQPGTMSIQERNKLVEVTSENQLLRQYVNKMQSKEVTARQKVIRHLKTCEMKDKHLQEFFVT